MALHKSKFKTPLKRGLAFDNNSQTAKFTIEKRKYIPVNHFITFPKVNGNFNFIDINKTEEQIQNSYIDIIENTDELVEI